VSSVTNSEYRLKIFRLLTLGDETDCRTGEGDDKWSRIVYIVGAVSVKDTIEHVTFCDFIDDILPELPEKSWWMRYDTPR